MKIACVTYYDAMDPRSFGGRVYYSLQALRQNVAAMHFIGPLSHPWFVPMIYLKREYYRRIQGLNYNPRRDRRMVMNYGSQISRRLRDVDAEIIFSPMSPNSQPIAYLKAKQPIVIWTDATFAGLIDFLPYLRRDFFCTETLRDGIEVERMALSRAALVIYYSEWAAQSAFRFYGLEPAKVRVIPPGPARDVTINFEEAKQSVRARPKDRCRLLFVGMDWARKGGATAIEVARRLNATGLATELVVVGSEPPDKPLPEFVRALGYIDPASKDGRAELDQLYRTSHFMIVPTQADPLGLVFIEASAFALPSIATDVGGVPEVVRSGVNGATFPLSADPDKYCAYIEDMFSHYYRYEQLALSAFGEFQTRLNNQTAAASVINAMRELL
jgi:glycosyltransferase involved in cell wall biosynthesis